MFDYDENAKKAAEALDEYTAIPNTLNQIASDFAAEIDCAAKEFVPLPIPKKVTAKFLRQIGGKSRLFNIRDESPEDKFFRKILTH